MRVTERDSGWLFGQSLIEGRVLLLGYGTDLPEVILRSALLDRRLPLCGIHSPHPDWGLIIQPDPLGLGSGFLLLVIITVGSGRGSRVAEEVDWEHGRVLRMFLSVDRLSASGASMSAA